MKLLLPIVLLLLANPDPKLYPVQSGVQAHKNEGQRYGYQLETVNEQIQQLVDVWEPSTATVNLPEVGFFTSKDTGGVFNARITRSSGSKQIDAECLQAVCTNQPHADSRRFTGELEQREIDFEKMKPRHSMSPELQRQIDSSKDADRVFVNQIPFSVWSCYPQLVSVQELRQGDNLLSLAADEYEAKIRHQGAVWANFFATHPTPTRQEINDCALSLK